MFGITLGWVLTLMGAFRYFVLLEHTWIVGLIIGVVTLITTVIFPMAIQKPQDLIKKVGGFVATQLFRALLAVVYFVAILPVGLIYQKTKGTHPFYSWTDSPPANIEGWCAKQSTDEAAAVTVGKGKQQNFLLQPIQVLGYFASRGELLFMPCLVLFLVLGVLGIFAQSTGLAPLIYTLF